MDKQSFRAQLVEWLGEIVPYGQIDKYTRKTREGIETSPYNTDRHANHVNYIFCTAEHRYAISATPTYLGCIASATRQRPGENWTRGNDLPDGPFCRETWESIKNRIIGFEMVKLDPVHVSRGVPDGPLADPKFSAPEQVEYNEAYHGIYLAQERFEKAKRVLNGDDKCDPEMPSTRAAEEPDDVEALAAVPEPNDFLDSEKVRFVLGQWMKLGVAALRAMNLDECTINNYLRHFRNQVQINEPRIRREVETFTCDNDLCRGGTEHHPSCKGLTKEQAERKSKTK